MLIAVLLIIGKDWKKNPKCLATRYELNIVGVFIKVKCYIATKRYVPVTWNSIDKF